MLVGGGKALRGEWMAHQQLDPRIGLLASGEAYAFVHGYRSEPVRGSVQQVKDALRRGDRAAQAKPLRVWSVRMRFEFPAWDEVDGILFEGIRARTKAEANADARSQAGRDGHLHGGKGRVWFAAAETTTTES